MTDQRSVSSMPGVTLTFVLADGPGDGLRNPVSTVTPSSSMVDFFSGASPLLPQAQFRLIVASNRVRLEDLVTEHELGDSSEVVARRVAGYLDLVASIALPLAYLLFILVYLLQYEAASTIQRTHDRKRALNSARRFHSTDEDHFRGTKFVHESSLGVETSKCCFRRGPAQG